MPFNYNFYCGYFDIYHSGMAQPALFFVTVYIVKISTVECLVLTVAISQTWDLMISWSDN